MIYGGIRQSPGARKSAWFKSQYGIELFAAGFTRRVIGREARLRLCKILTVPV